MECPEEIDKLKAAADAVAYWLERVLIDAESVRWKPNTEEYGNAGWYPSAQGALEDYRQLTEGDPDGQQE